MSLPLAPLDSGATLRLLDELFARAVPPGIGFQLWDGRRWPDSVPRAATIVLKHPGALQAMALAGGEKGLAEAYLQDHFDVLGDLETACGLVDVSSDSAQSGWRIAAKFFWSQRRSPPLRVRSWQAPGWVRGRRHSRARDEAAVRFHYDLSNAFYQLWLDSRMLYSCAYFDQADDDLETAQRAKLDHLCRKLRLRPGMRLLDIGCGWGGLALHAAQHYQVQVTGVTLSARQEELAVARVAAAGAGSQVVIARQDYRDLAESDPFDALVSVGMAEHVGAEQLETYFRKTYALLKPGGVFLNHAIGEGVRARPARGGSFIQEYVFPDSDLQRISFVLTAAEKAGFEVRDVENLREHYRLTLRHWVQRLEAAHAQVLHHVDEGTYRIWRLYMAGSAYGFARGRLAIYQSLLAKPEASGRVPLPLTRRDWYPAVAGPTR